MPIELEPPAPAPTDGQRLYVLMARALASLSFGERMALANALSRGDAFLQLPPRYRLLFVAVADALVRPGPPGAPW
jgi:hypothetical protein